MLLVVDNGSVYTRNLVDFLTNIQICFATKTPDRLDLGSLVEYDSVILSGRRKNEQQTNKINSKIIEHSIKYSKKLLGICYGAEILALTLGGTIRKTESPQKGYELIAVQKENMICDGEIRVFESHGYEISKLPSSLICIGKSANCDYEIIQYKSEPIFGTQFHPEMSHDGNNLIAKFCSI